MKLKVIAAICAFLITTPIWFFLLYKILVLVNASELMFFLFWIYVPLTVFVGVVSRLAVEE